MRDNTDSVFFKEIGDMVKQIKILSQESVAIIKPQVENIIGNHIIDEKQIERLLDVLLDQAGMCNDGLMLFKRLCRYYFPINPNATDRYVYAYRDMYDSDAYEESENQD